MGGVLPTTSLASENALPPKLDINVGAKSHFFQPPKPTAVETLHQSTTSVTNDNITPNASRKRSRHQYSLSDSATPSSALTRSWEIPSGYSTPNVASPEAFVNTQYRLAGGLDTPTAAFASSIHLNDGRSVQRDTRRNHRGIGSGEYFPHIPSGIAREANGRPRTQRPHAHDGWGRTIYSVIGAAGKVWDFCKYGAFRGFYAGKGPGYALDCPKTYNAADDSLQWHDMDEKAPPSFYETHGGQVLIPGRFPEEDFIEDYMSYDHRNDNTPPRAAKKLQRSQGKGEMREDWVMVGQTGTPGSSRQGSPVRLSGRKLPPASSASRRRPPANQGKKPLLFAHCPSLTSHAGSPGMRLGRPASIASPRSPLTSPSRGSPVSVEVQQHAARMRRREMEEDANLKRFNHQLKAMIRQGKEALRTTVEVTNENDMVDEGYDEGSSFEEREKG
ncbi:MAG: hypothetical protein Q9183_000215 [Haloplaca sp. 2 TL-2023]